MEFIERRHSVRNPGQTSEEIFTADSNNLEVLRQELKVPGKIEEIRKLIRRKEERFGGENEKLAQAVLAKSQADKSLTQEQEKRELSPEQIEKVLRLLKIRLEAKENGNPCPNLDWSRVERALKATPKSLWSANEMEQNGHEPAIYQADNGGFDIGTRAKEAPASTRNCVYDEKAARWLKENCPDAQFNGSAESQAKAMGIDLMTTDQGEYIAKNTPSYFEQGWRWFKTPQHIRESGSALIGLRDGHALTVRQNRASNLYDYGGWGGSLRVNFVK